MHLTELFTIYWLSVTENGKLIIFALYPHYPHRHFKPFEHLIIIAIGVWVSEFILSGNFSLSFIKLLFCRSLSPDHIITWAFCNYSMCLSPLTVIRGCVFAQQHFWTSKVSGSAHVFMAALLSRLLTPHLSTLKAWKQKWLADVMPDASTCCIMLWMQVNILHSLMAVSVSRDPITK